MRMKAFADARYAKDKENGRSFRVIATEVGGALLLWSFRIQSCVTLWSSEAEYLALSDCAKDVFYLGMLIAFLCPKLPSVKVFIS